MCSDTLSRLKGIETHIIGKYFQTNTKVGSDTLSRLKGIETIPRRWRTDQVRWVQIRFPVWRELKPICFVLFPSGPISEVQIRFPVWRELKLLLFSLQALSESVQIRFPVWRELKLLLHEACGWPASTFRYAFPFEGNWNPSPLGCCLALQ